MAVRGIPPSPGSLRGEFPAPAAGSGARGLRSAALAAALLGSAAALFGSAAALGAPPVVDSFAPAAPSVLPGGTVTLSLSAHDPDCASAPCTSGCGAYIVASALAIVPSAGTVQNVVTGGNGSPFQATAEWVAPAAEGSYTVDATIYDSGSSLCGGRQTASATLSIQVSASLVPVITSFTATPDQLLPGARSGLTASATDPLGRPLSFAFAADAGSVQQDAPGSPSATWTAPDALGTVTLRCTATPAGGAPATKAISVTVVPGVYSSTIRAGRALRMSALPDGRVASVSPYDHEVRVADLGGTLSWTRVLSEPIAVASTSDRLYVLDRGEMRIVVYSLDGTLVATLPYAGQRPVDLAAGPGPGQLAVADQGTNSVWLVSASTGAPLSEVGGSVLGGVTAVTSFNGSLAAVDAASHAVFVFDGTGTLTAKLDGGGVTPFYAPSGIAWDPVNSQLAISDIFAARVVLMKLDGTVRGNLAGLGGSAGQLVSPSGVGFVAGGLLAVPDVTAGAVSLYRVVASSAPIAVVTADPAVCGTGPRTASVTDAGPGAGYAWTISGGTILSGNGTRQVSWSPAGPGQVLLSVAVTQGGYTTNGSAGVVVSPGPETPVPTASGPACVGESVRLQVAPVAGAAYAWTGPNGFTSFSVAPLLSDLTEAASGVYTVTVSVGSCVSAPGQIVLTVAPAPTETPALSAPSSVQAGQAGIVASVPDKPGASWAWTIQNGTIASGQGTSRVTFTAGTTGWVQLSVAEKNANGCAGPAAQALVPIAGLHRWVVPGMAYTPGALGTFWVTDLDLYNPHGSLPITVEAAFLDGARPVDPAKLGWVPVTLAPGQVRKVTNVLSTLFGLQPPAFGALLVRAVSQPADPVLSGRNYNDQGASGTFGLSLPASPVENGLRVQDAGAGDGRSTLIGLKEDAAGRTNLMLTNLGEDAATVEVRLYDAAGSMLGSAVTVALEPLRMLQLSRILSAAPPLGASVSSPVGTFRADVALLSGTAVYPYATVVDNTSGDPIFIGPSPSPAPVVRLGGIVRARGVNGTTWRSDLVVQNPAAVARRVRIAYTYESEADGYAVRHRSIATVDVAAGETLELLDFVKQWLYLADGDNTNYVNPTLDVAPASDDPSPSSPLLVLGRTYNDQPTGKFGLQVNPFTAADGLSEADSAGGLRLVLPGLAATAAFRSNVVVLLATSDPAGAASGTVRVLDGSGTSLKTVPFALDQATRPTLQMNSADLFGGLPGDLSRLTVAVESVTGTAPVAAYATVVDQVSGDSTFATGQTVANAR